VLPVIIIGEWTVGQGGRKAMRNNFPWKKFVSELAKHAVVILADENLTSRACGICGSYNTHPSRPGNKTWPCKATVQCTNLDCLGRGMYLSRDTAAAATIGQKFVYTYFMGGEAG
jgi:transposase